MAKGIHEKGNRANMSLIEVNCAAIPGELIESELFGHERGAFTGASSKLSVSLSRPTEVRCFWTKLAI